MCIRDRFKGGRTSRSGYAVSCKEELPEDSRDYLERVAAPYYAAMAAWLEPVSYTHLAVYKRQRQ